ncbi:MAG: RsmE family RNA methyltransferase [Candidatus Dormibacteria bacterium]
MPTFFVEAGADRVGDLVHISGDDAWHMSRVLRLGRGATVTLVPEVGTECEAVLEEVGPDLVSARVLAARRRAREPRAQLHILQAIPKGPGMAEVCERLAELGASSIWPVLTERTIPRLEEDQARARQLRWQRVAKEAAQLARRHRAPEVHHPMPLADVVKSLRQREAHLQWLACDQPSARTSISAVAWDPGEPTAIVVGPEGGLSPSELDAILESGGVAVSLGPRNLRTLLAASVATVVLLQRAGDLESNQP